jgi:RimJ/RimL family protein N-acetyltransferase
MVDTELVLRDGRKLVLREAEIEDAAAILNHLAAVSVETDFLAFGKGDLNIGLDEEEDFIDIYRQSAVELLLAAFVGARLVGTLTFSGNTRPRLRHTGELGMSVRKDFWGLGVGSLMLDFLIRWARDGRTLTKLNLRVRVDNERAVRLYQRKGFAIEGTISRDIRIAGHYHSQHCMGLEL